MKDLERTIIVGIKLIGISNIVGTLGILLLAALGISAGLMTKDLFIGFGIVAISAIPIMLITIMGQGFAAKHFFGWGRGSLKGYLLTGGVMWLIHFLANLPGVILSFNIWGTLILAIPISGYIGMTFFNWK